MKYVTRWSMICLSILILYFYIFAPPFKVLPFGSDKIIIIVILFIILINGMFSKIIYFYKYEMFFLGLIALFSIYVDLFNGHVVCSLNDTSLVLFLFPCSYGVLWSINHITDISIKRILFMCVSLASFFSFFLILNPNIAYDLKINLLRYPEELLNTFIYRGYGLADGLLFSYPVIQGICIGLIILGYWKYGGWGAFFASIMLIAVFTNARSGFVPILFSLLIVFVLNTRKFLKVGSFFIIIVLCITVLDDFMEKSEMLSTSFEWSMTTFDIINDFLLGKTSENLEALLGDMLVFPVNLQDWLLGTGNYLFVDGVRTTDIGFLLRLNYGGIFYLSLMLALYFYMFYRICYVDKKIAIYLLFTLLYCNYKSDFFIFNSGVRFVFLLYVLITCPFFNSENGEKT